MSESNEPGQAPAMAELQEAAESLEQAMAWLARHVNVSRTVGVVRPGHTDLELEDHALDAFLIALRSTVDNVRYAALELARLEGAGGAVRIGNPLSEVVQPAGRRPEDARRT